MSTAFITGSQSLYGFAIERAIKTKYDIINDLNLCFEDMTDREIVSMLKANNCKVAVLAGGWSFGIQGNLAVPASLGFNGLQQVRLIQCCLNAGVERLVYLGSSCMYPRGLSRNLVPADIGSGFVEETSKTYASIKLAGGSLCEAVSSEFGLAYSTVIPSNVYGPRDEFRESNMHVMYALCYKALRSKIEGHTRLLCGGTGSPVRDFLHVDDFANAVLLILTEKIGLSGYVNVGSGSGTSIADLATLIADEVGLEDEVVFDLSVPDGVPYKVLDVSVMEQAGWRPAISLKDGIKDVLDWMKVHMDEEGKNI